MTKLCRHGCYPFWWDEEPMDTSQNALLGVMVYKENWFLHVCYQPSYRDWNVWAIERKRWPWIIAVLRRFNMIASLRDGVLNSTGDEYF